ncbi:MAG: FG-GAP repeat domain-containing protein, partial [Ilumatobacter sp.]
MTGTGSSVSAGSDTQGGRTNTTRRGSGARLRRFAAIASTMAVGASVLALPSPPVAAQVIIPGATTFTEPFDDDNFQDFSASTARWNDGFLSLPLARPVYGGLRNNSVQVSPDMDAFADLAVGDLDGDGNDDIVAVSDGATRWYAGDGTTDPFTGAVGVDIGPAHGPAVDVELADVEGDGDLDVIVVYPAGTPGLVIHENSGTSTPFSTDAPRLVSNAVGHTQVVAGFFNDDADIDIVTFGQDIWYFQNQGNATPFSAQFPTIVSNDNATIGVPTDLNRDGELDLVVGMENGDVRWFGNDDGAGAFSTSGPFELVRSGAGTAITELAVGDLDVNGTLEVFIEEFGGGASEIGLMEFDESGDFVDSGTQGMAADPGFVVTDVEIYDMDNDGDRDIVQIGNDGSFYEFRWFRNDGIAEWWTTAAPLEVSRSSATFLSQLAIADFDRDGDFDSVVAASGSPNPAFDILRYFEHVGSTSPFIDAGSSLTNPADIADVESLDIDGDGDLDFAVSPGNGSNVQVYLNNADGTFANPVGVGGNGVRVFDDLHVGDYNLDGVSDAAVVGANPDPANNEIVFVGSAGTPGVLTTPVTTPAPNAISVLLADVDGDGADDLVVGTDGTNASTVTLNDRVGPDFYDNGAILTLDNLAGAVVRLLDAGDTDGDGLEDILGSVVGGSNFAYWLGSDLGNRLDLGGAEPTRFAAFFDRSNDGDLDVFTQDENGTVLLYTSFGSFIVGSPQVIGLGADSASGVEVADGRVVFNDGGTLTVIASDGLNSQIVLPTGGQTDGFVVGDFDGDGDEDLQVFEPVGGRRFENISTGPPRTADRDAAQLISNTV